MARSLDQGQSAMSQSLGDDFLPLPPPPPDVLGVSAQPNAGRRGEEETERVPPPPQLAFAKLQQQRQISELKRLYKHMHPELRRNLQGEVGGADWEEVLDAEYSAASLPVQGPCPDSQALPQSQTEVQSMRWIFDNWPLDTIGDHAAAKKLKDEETILSGDVRNTSWRFEHQEAGRDWEWSGNLGDGQEEEMMRKGDVSTARWLFETQPMDSLNKLCNEDNAVQEAVLKEAVQAGDVRATKLLFETQDLGRSESTVESSLLQLRSELREMRGDVSKTVKLFETEPLCAIRDSQGQVHQVRSICREEVQDRGSVQSTRWLFETQPLGSINRDGPRVKIIRGISLEGTLEEGGGVGKNRWLFETQALDSINEVSSDQPPVAKATVTVTAGDVNKKCWLFESQPLDSLREGPAEQVAKEEVIAGKVDSTLWLFETRPMDMLRDSCEVGQLRKVAMGEEERGDVRHKTRVFQSRPLESISKEQGQASSSEEIQRGDVKAYKHLFETLPLDSIKQSDERPEGVQEEMVFSGNVKENRALFETVPLYAIMDGAGGCHQLRTVSRELVVGGDVKHYRWMFETRPLHEMGRGSPKVELVRGITMEEEISTETARWLFETQPLDAQVKDKEVQASQVPRGDVKRCRWLFETRPADAVCEEVGDRQGGEVQAKGDVKSYTWLFETQTMDSMNQSEERHLRVRGQRPETTGGVDVKTTKRLFETEQVGGDIGGENGKVRYTSEVDIQTGNVSRVKEIYQSRSLSDIGEVEDKVDHLTAAGEKPGSGCVHKATWLFENFPLGSIKEEEDTVPKTTVSDVKGGDVGGKRFVFETCSLDQIHEGSPAAADETGSGKEEGAGDVISGTKRFHSQPLYALRDKEGQYHEVTTAQKEEILRGDVRGTRWLFETKPLDTIRPSLDEVFVLRAVTQEDVNAGDVKAARWRFETQPLDLQPGVVDQEVGGEMGANGQLFQGQRYVRTVSLSDVQSGDVRTSTWLFENLPIDSLKGEEGGEGPSPSTVHREDVEKGDVKRCTWLFESRPLDSLKDSDRETKEEAPCCPDVKTTTWLFETTPLDMLVQAQGCSGGLEMSKRSVRSSLEILVNCGAVRSRGLVVESNQAGVLKMAKYQLLNPSQHPHIVKEEVIGGSLQRILAQLLQRKECLHREGVVLKEDRGGRVSTRKIHLFSQSQVDTGQKRAEEDTVYSFLTEDSEVNQGLLIQECEKGIVQITIYSLANRALDEGGDNRETIKGDVKSTINSLLASAQQQTASTVKREENERGKVQLYTTCIEAGTLDHLNACEEQDEEGGGGGEDLPASPQKEEIVRGDVEGAIRNLTEDRGQVEKTIDDVVPGDVKATKRYFLAEGQRGQECVQRDGGLGAGIVVSASMSPGKMVEVEAKEDLAGGDVHAKLQMSETAGQRGKGGVISRGSVEALESVRVAEGAGISRSSAAASVEGAGAGTELRAAMQNLREVTAEAHEVQQRSGVSVHPGGDAQVGQGPHRGRRCRDKAGRGEVHVLGSSSSSSSSSSQASCYRAITSSSSSSIQVAAAQRQQHQVSVSEPLVEATRSGQGDKCGHVTGLVRESWARPQPPATDLEEEEEEEEEAREQSERQRDQDTRVTRDLEATIEGLKDSRTEQAEEVAPGSLQLALQALGKAHMNISQGDFKAAMIYTAAGQTLSREQMKSGVGAVCGQGSLSGSDARFPSPIPVTKSKWKGAGSQPAVQVSPPDQTPPAVHRHPARPNPQSPTRILPSQPPAPKPQVVVPAKAGGKPALPPKPRGLQATRPLPSPLVPPRGSAPTVSKSDASPPAACEATDPRGHSDARLQSRSQQPGEESTTMAPCSTATRTSLHLAQGKDEQAKEGANRPTGEGTMPTPSSQDLPQRTTKPSVHLHPNQPASKVDNAPNKPNTGGDILGFTQSSSQGSTARTDVGQGNRSSPHTARSQNQPNAPPQTSECGRREQNASMTEERPSLPTKVSPKASVKVTAQQTDRPPQPSTERDPRRLLHGPGVQAAQCHPCPVKQGGAGQVPPATSDHQPAEGVVLRRDRQQSHESEDARRKRLSIHKDEILRGNVRAAMEIFEKMKKREELQKILTQVREFEEETFKVDVKGLKSLFEIVPDWVVPKNNVVKRARPSRSQQEVVQAQPRVVKEEGESLSSVEVVFGDLERASEEIFYLKEQTLAKLQYIEESIKKALYSVSNLKSESDIAGLSGLFGESLGTVSNSISGHIQKISLASSRSSAGRGTQLKGGQEALEEHPRPSLDLPPASTRVVSPSSPSYISIESAVRKPTGPWKKSLETFSPSPHGRDVPPCPAGDGVPLCNGCQRGTRVTQQSRPREEMAQGNLNLESAQPIGTEGKGTNSPVGSCSSSGLQSNAADNTVPQRSKSVVEFKTGPDGGEVVGTKTVMEKYEEIDRFGNKIITSKTSTTVTKQSESTTSSMYEVVQASPSSTF